MEQLLFFPYGVRSFCVQFQHKRVDVDVYERRFSWVHDAAPGPFHENEVHKTFLSDTLMQECISRSINAMAMLPIASAAAPLPPGASHDVYIHLIDQLGRDFYYTNTYEKNFFVEHTQAPQAAEALIGWLRAQVQALEEQPSQPAGSNSRAPGWADDPRYLEETLWQCSFCGHGNLFSSKTCVKCGLPKISRL